MAEALEPLSALTDALKAAVFSWSAVRELTRVVVPETELEWIEAARGKTVREIEAMVRGRRPGDRPSDPASWDAKRHMISFEVTGATRALFREALEKVRRDAGSRLDDDAALALVARQILGGPTDEGRASHQIVVMKCPECGRMGQESAGTVVPIDAFAQAAAECDAQVVDLDAHVGRSGELAEVTHVGENKEPRSRTTTHRATQTIPPATRRLVVRRQHRRCGAPACRHSAYLEVHHVHLRSERRHARPRPAHRAVHRSPFRPSRWPTLDSRPLLHRVHVLARRRNALWRPPRRRTRFERRRCVRGPEEARLSRG